MPDETSTFDSIRDYYFSDKTARALMRINLMFMEFAGIQDSDIEREFFGAES